MKVPPWLVDFLAAVGGVGMALIALLASQGKAAMK
jgi:hypothetical protein